MDILRVLQTIGICVGALALVAIAIMLFLVVSSFVPTEPAEEDDPLRFLRGKSQDEIHALLTTPVYEPRPRRKTARQKG